MPPNIGQINRNNLTNNLTYGLTPNLPPPPSPPPPPPPPLQVQLGHKTRQLAEQAQAMSGLRANMLQAQLQGEQLSQELMREKEQAAAVGARWGRRVAGWGGWGPGGGGGWCCRSVNKNTIH